MQRSLKTSLIERVKVARLLKRPKLNVQNRQQNEQFSQNQQIVVFRNAYAKTGTPQSGTRKNLRFFGGIGNMSHLPQPCAFFHQHIWASSAVTLQWSRKLHVTKRSTTHSKNPDLFLDLCRINNGRSWAWRQQSRFWTNAELMRREMDAGFWLKVEARLFVLSFLRRKIWTSRGKI